MNREADAKRLAPVAPPCFSSRGQWIEYVQTAAEHQRAGSAPGPLVIERGQPVRFNRHFNLCQDCTQPHALAMAKQARCKPTYLLVLIPAEPGREPVRPRIPKAVTA